MNFSLRDFCANDATAVNQLALAAFDEYRSAYADWPAFSKNIGNMATLAQQGELIVAQTHGSLVGAVVYVGPGKPKGSIFNPEWSIIRMLVVHPEACGLGLGRTLTNECIRRAERDKCGCVALHTTPIMKAALTMYERLGFKFLKEAPPIFGVPYGVYVKQLPTKPVYTAREDVRTL